MLTATFDEERETKGTVRFTERIEEGEEPVIGTLYVRKTAIASLGFKSGDHRSLTVTIEREEVE